MLCARAGKAFFVRTRPSVLFINGFFMTLNFFWYSSFTCTDCRYAFVVSKKVSRKAVQRNRIRRMMRASFLSLDLPRSLILKKTFCVFYARQNITCASFRDISRDMREIYSRGFS